MTNYTTSEALAGIIVFECVERHQEREAFKRYYERDGVCEVREMCLVLGSYIDRIYDSCNMSDIYSEPFDLELVPRILERLKDPFRADLVLIQKAMLEVVQEADAAEELRKLGGDKPKPAWQIEADANIKISAVKLYRALHKCSLKEACNKVCDYMQETANG